MTACRENGASPGAGEKQELFMELGVSSLNKHGETLCGDFYTFERREELSTLVLSDGLGSGVKANILSTLTATILGTMMSSRMSIEDCVSTMARTLPVCQERHLAYSTFTILQVDHRANSAYLAQYDNPRAILLRNGRHVEYPFSARTLGGKEILESRFSLEPEDLLLLCTDGVTNAGLGKTMVSGWPRDEVIRYLENTCLPVSSSPQQVAASIAGAGRDLSLGSPDDDITVLAAKMRPRRTVSLLIGPPADPAWDQKVLRRFFQAEGKHIVCGGSTAKMVSRYLDRPLTVSQEPDGSGLPAISFLDGVDLVTEGMLTLMRTVELGRQYSSGTQVAVELRGKKDGASQIARALFEEATDVLFFVGGAVNAAHSRELQISRHAKANCLKTLTKLLRQQGRRVTVLNF